jgi:hypothetical protein
MSCIILSLMEHRHTREEFRHLSILADYPSPMLAFCLPTDLDTRTYQEHPTWIY